MTWDDLLHRMLRKIMRGGSMVLHFPNGRVERYGDGTGEPFVVRITDPSLPARLVRSPDLALGEGYTDGGLTIDGDDLRGFMHFATRSAERAGRVWWRRPVILARRALRGIRQFNRPDQARRRVAHHYDLSSELYALFLDADRQYSCAYFKRPDDSLETAQAQKKAHIAAKLRLEPGMRVLDIGCGWGGMALTLARDHGAQVLGVTLSEEQHRIATGRAHEAGLESRVEFRLTDYRNVRERFDRVVSVGMFEHVGVPHYREYFRTVHDRLTEDGVALIHTIGRAQPPATTSAWIDRYIFPGGYIPALSEIAAAVEREDFYITDVEVWRLHYAETLRHWYERFMANIDRARAIYDERFCRMWRYYLAASEMSFRANRHVVFQLQMSRRLETLPLTLDYLYREPEGRADLYVAAEQVRTAG